LGISSEKMMRSYPWHSVDGTTWALNAAYGCLLVPKGDRWESTYAATPNVIPVSKRKLSERGHILNRKAAEQKNIRNYLNEKRLQLGV
jgi:hypothetical protein